MAQNSDLEKVVGGAVGGFCGVKGGAVVGATIGTFLCPGAGTLVGAKLGAIAGGIFGTRSGFKDPNRAARSFAMGQARSHRS